jgi:2-keto-4-pentenoate hydratase/2-oxohepta-3-ene-1,7-dioic acid hydratase in catechol pathway
LRDEGIVPIDAVLGVVRGRPPQERLAYLIEHFARLHPELEQIARGETPIPVDQITFGPAIPGPAKLCCAARNYREHGSRAGDIPIEMFLKSYGALLGSGGTVELPPVPATIFHHEAELAVVIGRRAHRVPAAEAMDYVFGYTPFIDVSARGLVPGNFFTGKSFDTFAPIGAAITTSDEVPDPHQLQVQLWVNDDLRQDYSTADMGNQIPALIEYASLVTTLEPGDVIATGTNHQGLSALQDGDQVRVRIERLGELRVRVSDAERRSWPRGIDQATAQRARG